MIFVIDQEQTKVWINSYLSNSHDCPVQKIRIRPSETKEVLIELLSLVLTFNYIYILFYFAD